MSHALKLGVELSSNRVRRNDERVDSQHYQKGSEVLAQAYMSLAVILAQWPVGGDQMHPDSPYEDASSTGNSDWDALWLLFAVPFFLFVVMPLGAKLMFHVLTAIDWIYGKLFRNDE